MEEMSFNIGDVRIDFASRDEVLQKVGALLGEGGGPDGNLLCTTNPEFVLAAWEDPEFRHLINNSFLSVPDGVGVVFAREYLDAVSGEEGPGPLFRALQAFKVAGSFVFNPESVRYARVSGADLIDDLCALAARDNHTVFFLGGWPTDFVGQPISDPGYDIATEAARKMQVRYPGLNVVGASSKFSSAPKDDAFTIKYIKDCLRAAGVDSLDMLFVCYGGVVQEKCASRIAKEIPAKLSVGLGGTFDYVAGVKKRAPKLIRDFHLEWLHRLVTQPWRIGRIFKSVVIFPLKVMFISDRNS
jgi:N-acetylglucosaminyldiphosphoundecaprenol N-acetyl-beta-D-mannosaminyltransferase